MNGLTIGQAAAFAGITIKTVRHYHQHGLVAEPTRDSSGYRRYGSAELLRLVQVKTLASAGIPLAEIGALLDADPERFADGLADVELRLTARIEDLIARRETLRQLAQGDRVLLPERARALLDRIARIGIGEEDLAILREGLILTRALVPEAFEDYLAQVEKTLEDPTYVALHLRGWRTKDWDPDDPRLEELATELVEHMLAHPEHLAIPTGPQAQADSAGRLGLYDRFKQDHAPAWARLTELITAKLRAAGVRLPG